MKRHRSTAPSIETLESRIAPAALIAFSTDHKTATWTDVDGDKVTLRISKGLLDDTLFTKDTSFTTGLLVKKLDLTGAAFAGTNVTLSAVREPLTGGDNTVNLGYLDAAGHALGAVAINGDLGRIDAGDPVITAKTPRAIAALTVHSMGMLDGATLPAGVTQTSEIIGKTGPVKVRGSVKGILFNVTGGDAGSIASLNIGGSLLGTADADSGRFSTSGRVGPIVIGGSIVGGAGQHSGSIEAGGAIVSLTLGGSLLGGRSDTPSTDGTGVVRTDQTLGPVVVRGSIQGGTQQDSGLISAAGNADAVRIVGGIVGGSAGTSSGGIFIGGNAAVVVVKGDVLGGAALDSGVIHVAGKTGALTLLGALTGSTGRGSGSVWLGTDASDTTDSVSIARDVTGGTGDGSGAIHAAGRVTALKITGTLHGASGAGTGAVAFEAGAGSVAIGGDIAGSTGAGSGRLDSIGHVVSIQLGGDLLGGTADGSGSITGSGRFETLTIGGSVLGGNLAADATTDLTGSGWIQAARIGALTIGGALAVGEDFNSAHRLVNNAAIRVDNYLGALTIAGGIQGTEETSVFITAGGAKGLLLDQKTDPAFDKVTIGSSVRHASILAGYGTDPDVRTAALHADAQIGEVTVNGDWIASNLVAGAAWSENFGDGHDHIIPGVDSSNIVARIAKIGVTGQIIGTGGIATDRFGFVAQEIAEMKIGPDASAISLNSGKGNDTDPVTLRYNLAGTLDVRVFEFA